jgi:hypothetical protein
MQHIAPKVGIWLKKALHRGTTQKTNETLPGHMNADAKEQEKQNNICRD